MANWILNIWRNLFNITNSPLPINDIEVIEIAQYDKVIEPIKANPMEFIKYFQETNGLVADGIMGKNTITKMQEVFKIKSKTSIAHFLGQLDHETSGFKYGVENLNYSTKRLLQVFPKYFTKIEAIHFANEPEIIANRVYANRIGNGNEASGDGWKFRGRGAIQITGRANYQEFAEYIGDPEILSNPDIIITKYYWDVALWYFEKRNIWKYTNSINDDNIKKVTKLINGGYNGLIHRVNLTLKYYDTRGRL